MKFTAAQQRALDCADNLWIDGVPGSGKTTLLLEIASRAIRNGTPPSQVMFAVSGPSQKESIKAALAERLGKKGQLVQVDHISELARHELATVEIRVPQASGGVLKRCIQIALDGVSGDEAQEGQTKIMLYKAQLPDKRENCPTTLELVGRYNSELRRRGFFDKSDLLLMGATAFEDGVLPLRHVELVLVDDAQDLTPVAHEWVYQHVLAGARSVLAGDASSTIFAYNGSAGEPGLDGYREKTAATRVCIDESHRCAANLLTAAAQTTGQAKARSAQNEHARLQWVPVSSRQEEMDEILSRAHQGDLAVLARTRAQLDQIETALIVGGVPYHRHHARSVLADPALRSLIDILNAVCRPSLLTIRQALSWLGRSSEPWRPIALQHGLPTGLEDLFRAPLTAEAAELHLLPHFIYHLQEWGERAEQQPRETLQSILDWLRDNQARWRETLVGWLADDLVGSFGSLPDIADHLEYLLLHSFSDDAAEGGVVLSTVHAARGLGFERVWVCGLEAGLFPEPRMPWADEMRLLHVAMTRASRGLTLSGVLSVPGDCAVGDLQAKIASVLEGVPA